MMGELFSASGESYWSEHNLRSGCLVEWGISVSQGFLVFLIFLLWFSLGRNLRCRWDFLLRVLSAEDSEVCWGTSDEEEPQEALCSPPGRGSSKEVGRLPVFGCRVSGGWVSSWCFLMHFTLSTLHSEKIQGVLESHESHKCSQIHIRGEICWRRGMSFILIHSKNLDLYPRTL